MIGVSTMLRWLRVHRFASFVFMPARRTRRPTLCDRSIYRFAMVDPERSASPNFLPWLQATVSVSRMTS
jgi:hypothetical protein